MGDFFFLPPPPMMVHCWKMPPALFLFGNGLQASVVNSRRIPLLGPCAWIFWPGYWCYWVWSSSQGTVMFHHRQFLWLVQSDMAVVFLASEFDGAISLSGMYTLPHSLGMLYTPGNLRSRSSLTGHSNLDIFLGGRPNVLILHFDSTLLIQLCFRWRAGKLLLCVSVTVVWSAVADVHRADLF
jgi:hypothetical protein